MRAPEEMDTPSPSAGKYFGYFLSLILLGSTGIFSRFITMSSAAVIFFRMLLGGTVLLVFLLFSGRWASWEMRKRNLPMILVSGALLGMGAAALFEAYRYTSLSIAMITSYCSPMITMLLAPVLLHEKHTPAMTISVFITTGGLVLMNGFAQPTGEEKEWLGVVWALASACLYSVWVFTNKRISGISPLETTVYEMYAASLVMLVVLLITDGFPAVAPSGKEIWYIVFMGVICTGLAYYYNLSAVQILPAHIIALCCYIEPATTIALAAIILDERLTPVQWIGVLLILSAILFGEFYKGDLRKSGKKRAE